MTGRLWPWLSCLISYFSWMLIHLRNSELICDACAKRNKRWECSGKKTMGSGRRRQMSSSPRPRNYSVIEEEKWFLKNFLTKEPWIVLCRFLASVSPGNLIEMLVLGSFTRNHWVRNWEHRTWFFVPNMFVGGGGEFQNYGLDSIFSKLLECSTRVVS